MEPRRKLSLRDKLEILIRQSRCPICGEKLGAIEGLDFDHEVALVNGGTDSNDNLRAVHRDPCHRQKSHGPGGEKRITTAGSDNHIRRKTDDLSESQAAFRRALLRKETGEPKPPSRWGSRPFAKRKKEARR